MPHRNGLRRVTGALTASAVLSGSLLVATSSAAAEEADVVAPELASLSIEPSSVDASRGPVSVVVTARLTDALSGTASATVRLGDTNAEALQPLNGTARDGLWSGIATVPAGTPAGPVTTLLTLSDAAGNTATSTDPTALEATGSSSWTPQPVSAPAALTAKPEPAALSLSWRPPATPAEPVIGYDVTAGGTTTRVPADTTSFVATGLTNGVRYDVTVAAVGDSGQGPAATTTGAPRTVPTAPALGKVSAANASATLAWAAPSSDGGELPYAYRVTAAPSGRSYVLPASAQGATVGWLANGAGTSFQVAALNGAGSGQPSPASGVVTPRIPGTLVVLAKPTASIVYGRATGVRVDLRTPGNEAVAGRRVELLARVGTAKTYRTVGSATTDAAGEAVLRAVLPASSALRVRQLADQVAAPQIALNSVSVATKVTAAPHASRTRVGTAVTVRGRVSPNHATGSAIRLQQRTSRGWVNVANGKMTSTSAYAVSWRPPAVGSFSLRVLKPADADHISGLSPAFTQRVDPESVVDVARAIRANSRITLAEVHVGGVSDRATPKHNLADLAAGGLARRSSYGNAPGGSTPVDIRLLKALRRMGQLGTITVSEVAGGSHAPRSNHYSGKGVDITWVNGRHVGRGSSYAMVVDTCRSHGATQVFSPSNDPYGGHHNHVHCGWS